MKYKFFKWLASVFENLAVRSIVSTKEIEIVIDDKISENILISIQISLGILFSFPSL